MLVVMLSVAGSRQLAPRHGGIRALGRLHSAWKPDRCDGNTCLSDCGATIGRPSRKSPRRYVASEAFAHLPRNFPAAGSLNERGAPYSAKTVASMLRGAN